jgi:hypothetical protein
VTSAEYQQAYIRARKQWPNLTRQAMIELRRTYQAAGRLAAAAVRDSTRAGLSSITSAQYSQLQRQLMEGVNRINVALAAKAPAVVKTGFQTYAKIETRYLIDSVRRAGATQAIPPVLIRQFYVGLSNRVVEDVIRRVFSNGYSFSTRVWNAAMDFNTQINQVVSTGLAMNRDVVSIARDINVYVREGKFSVMKRYGSLIRGQSDFTRRIRLKVDYRALRLVRSELGASLQNASVQMGELNPASTHIYDWVRVNTEEWNCVCPELEENSPYRTESVPGYPHSNCMCQVRPRLMNNNVFVADLQRWVAGADVPYIGDWAARLGA